MIITAGCGIAQANWPDWPTWPKYCKIMYDCEHINIGSPAAGNWYLMTSIMKAIVENPDVKCVIVQWTNYKKVDLFLDETNPIDDVRNFNSRNWILDWQGHLSDENKGVWTSSVSYDNYYKKNYKPWYNETNHALNTFQNILSLEMFCKQRNVALYNFLTQEINIEKLKNNPDLNWLIETINWKDWPTLEPLQDAYENSAWYDYEVDIGQGINPVAGWHWDAFQEYISPILDKFYEKKNVDTDKMQNAVLEITRKKFNEYKNILAAGKTRANS